MARAAVLDEVELAAQTAGITSARSVFARMAKAGRLHEDTLAIVRASNARRGKHGRAISVSSLIAWHTAVEGKVTPSERICALAPKTRGKKWRLDDDVAAALAKYRQPNKPSLAWCVNEVLPQLAGVTYDSLYKRCQRAKTQLPAPLFHIGRNTGAALKALQPFRRRDYLSLSPNDVWVGDGHAAKLKIAHPDTGNPFQPEVTVIMDVSDRYIVGWSVSLSENCLAVSDALRHGVSQHGIPLIYYSDNGGGQKNKMIDAPVSGTASALGTRHETGRPGNPQGRGVVERMWATVLIPLAKRFATYQGLGNDHDTLRGVSREINQQLREAKRSEVAAMPKKLPTWLQFLEALEAEIQHYNTAHHHRSLPKLDGVNHATPAEYRAHRLAVTGVEIHIPPAGELAALFMPSVMRKCERGEVRLFNGVYFDRDLMLIDGRYAPVAYDIHDCSRVFVKHPDGGQLIAVAELNGNRGDYFPKPFIEKLRAERTGRRRALLESKLAEVQAEFDGGAQIEFRSPLERPVPQAAAMTPEQAEAHERLVAELTESGGGPVVQPRNVAQIDDPRFRYARWLRLEKRVQAGEELAGRDAEFFKGYAQDDEHHSMVDFFEEFSLTEAEFG